GVQTCASDLGRWGGAPPASAQLIRLPEAGPRQDLRWCRRPSEGYSPGVASLVAGRDQVRAIEVATAEETVAPMETPVQKPGASSASSSCISSSTFSAVAAATGASFLISAMTDSSRMNR